MIEPVTLEQLSLTATPGRELSLGEVRHYAGPRRGLPPEVNRWRRRNGRRVMLQALKLKALRAAGKALGGLTGYGRLSLVVIRADGRILDYGLSSMRVVSTAGVNFITDAFQNLVELENMKFHGIGTGTNAEAVGDTALQTELTTQYNPDSTRATGSLTEGAANVFSTVGTNAVDSAVAITEHAVFTQAAVGGGTLLDRSIFSAINLASGDSLQSTYNLTINAGG